MVTSSIDELGRIYTSQVDQLSNKYKDKCKKIVKSQVKLIELNENVDNLMDYTESLEKTLNSTKKANNTLE